MDALIAALERLLVQIQQHAESLLPTLQPGLSKKRETAHLQTLPGQLSQEVLALYQWHNGEDFNHTGVLVPGFLFLPMAYAVEVHQRYLHMRGPYFRWEQAWWPIFMDEDGRRVCFVLCQSWPQTTAPLYTLGASPLENEVWMAYDSLMAMADTIAACYDAGAYWVGWTEMTHEPYIAEEPRRVAATTRMLNPVRTAWWLAYVGAQDVMDLATFLPHHDATEAERTVRARAVAALRTFLDVQTVEPLIQVLHGPDVMAQHYAAQLLGDLGDQRAVLPLLYALQDDDYILRWHAAEALGKLGDQRAVLPLLQSLRVDARASDDLITHVLGRDVVRETVAHALGHLGDARAVPALLQAMQEAESPNAYIWALGELRARQASPALLQLLATADSAVRAVAAAALGKIRDLQAVEALIHALADRDPRVRWEAAAALGKLGDPRALPPLARLEHDHDSIVQEAARRARDILQHNNL